MIELGKDVLYVLNTETPHGKSDERILQAAREALLWDDMDGILEVCREEKGKPHFEGDPMYFSVTHSGKYWMCIFSKLPVGIDLQKKETKNKAEKISRRFFHPDEVDYLEKQDWVPFFDVWSAKESYVKYTGTGIAGELASFSVVQKGQIKNKIEGLPLRQCKEFPQYSLFICGGTDGEITIVSAEQRTGG